MFYSPAVRFFLMALLAIALPRALYSAGRFCDAQKAGETALTSAPASLLEGLLSEAEIVEWDDRTRAAPVGRVLVHSESSAGCICLVQDNRDGQASSDWSLLRQGSMLVA